MLEVKDEDFEGKWCKALQGFNQFLISSSLQFTVFVSSPPILTRRILKWFIRCFGVLIWLAFRWLELLLAYTNMA